MTRKRAGGPSGSRLALMTVMLLAGFIAVAARIVDCHLKTMQRLGVEYDLLPWCEKHKVGVMAYSPLDEGALAGDRRLAAIAARLGVSASQLAIAWVLRRGHVCAIPKASRVEHVRANAKARIVHLVQADEITDTVSGAKSALLNVSMTISAESEVA